MPNILNVFSKIDSFFKEVRIEVKKVNWPTAKQTVIYTLIVIAVSVVTAVFLGGIDFGFTTLLEKFVI